MFSFNANGLEADCCATAEYDVPVKLLPPAGAVARRYSYLTDGAMFWLVL